MGGAVIQHQTNWATLAISVALSGTSAGCFKPATFLKQSGVEVHSLRAGLMPADAEHQGQTKVTAVVSASSTNAQTLSTSMAQGSASVSFPPGSLAIDSEVTIEQGVLVANAVTAAQLGLGSTSSLQVGVPVAITSSTSQDAVTPFTVSLSLPSGSSLALADQYLNLLIVYKATLRGESKTVVGTIPRNKLTIVDGKVQFSASYFGNYQTVITGSTVQAVAQVTVPAGVISLSAASSLPAIAITARVPFAVTQGSTVRLTGKNFRSSMVLAYGSKPVSQLTVASDVSASFVVPAGAQLGLTTLAAEQDGASQSISLLYAGSSSDLPVITLPPASVCSGTKYYDANGQTQSGTRSCTQPDLSSLTAANILSGVTINGVTGTATASPANCSSDGATACVATSSYAAAATSGLASKVLAGSSVAGVAGNVTMPSVANVRVSNGAYGVGGTSITPTLADCSADGQQSCYATGVFKAANVTGVSTWDLASGVTLAGVAGTYKKNCRDKITSSAFNYDGSAGSLTNASFTAGTTLDYWDTTNDHAGFGAQRVAAWSTTTDCDATVWSDATTTDAGATTVPCGAGTSANCQFKDNLSGLVVSKPLGGSNWSAAVIACNNSTIGGFSAGTWRLPTHKEVMTLHIHGIVSQVNSYFMTLATMQSASGYWSSTTDTELGNTYAIVNYLANGGSSNMTKATTSNAFCVR